MARDTFKETMDQLLLLIRAGSPVIYLVSHEEARVLDCVARLFRVLREEQPRKLLFRWCQGPGLTKIDGLDPTAPPSGSTGWLNIPGLPELVVEKPRGNLEPEQALNSVRTATHLTDSELSNSVVVFFDIHPYLTSGQVPGLDGFLVRPLRNAADALRRYYDDPHKPTPTASKTIIIVSPSELGLSRELERDLIRIPFPLPETDELQQALHTQLCRGLEAPLLVLCKRFEGCVDQQEFRYLIEQRPTLTLDEYKTRTIELVAKTTNFLSTEELETLKSQIRDLHELRFQNAIPQPEINASSREEKAFTTDEYQRRLVDLITGASHGRRTRQEIAILIKRIPTSHARRIRDARE